MWAVITNYMRVSWQLKINTTCTNSHSVREIQNIAPESTQVAKDKQNTYEFTCYGGKIHKI